MKLIDLWTYTNWITFGNYILFIFCIKVDLKKLNHKNQNKTQKSIGESISIAFKIIIPSLLPVFNIVLGIYLWWNYKKILQDLIKDYEQVR